METITNIASTATTTVSNLIYGKENETSGKEPVSGQTGKGTVDEPYDQGNSESALNRETTSTTGAEIEPSREVEPTGSIQKPEDLINAYDSAAGDSTTTTTGSGSTATGITDKAGVTDKAGITDKAGVTDKLWKPTDVDAVKSSVTDPAAAPETGVGLHESSGKPATGTDTLWRGVDSYKETSSTGPTSTGPTSTGSTTIDSEPTRVTSESTSGGPKGAIDAEPKHYSVGDLTTSKETPSKSVDNNNTNTTSTTSKTGDSAVSPPDMSTTSPNSKPDYTADTQEPSHTGGLASEKAGHAGPSSTATAPAAHSSSISPSGDDDEKSGKMSALKDKLKNKLHIGHKDH